MRRISHRIFVVFTAMVVSLSLTSCDDEARTFYMPDIIKVGVLPDESRATLAARFAPYLTYLENKVGIPFELVIPESYDDLLKLFAAKEVDLAYFGAYTFWQAHQEYGAQPLLMRDVDTAFSSYIITHKDSNLSGIDDLQQRSFSFGSRLSTSGHIMPRYFFGKSKIDPEKYFSKISYSGTHSKTIEDVLSKKVDAGVANSLIVENTIAKPEGQNLNVIWMSPTYPDYILAVQNDFSSTLRVKIHAATLILSKEDNEEILNLLRANHFVSASLSDFEMLERAIDMLKQR